MREVDDSLELKGTASFKDYFYLIRNNLVLVSIIIIVSIAVSALYAFYQPDIIIDENNKKSGEYS